MNDLFFKGPDGKLVFTGREQEQAPPPKREPGAQMECPVCHGKFDYLVGDDTNDGGVRGCEKCWKPPKEGGKHVRQQEVEEIIS